MATSGIKLFAPACISMQYMGLKDLSIALDNPGNEVIAHINTESNHVEIDLFSKEKEDDYKTKDIILDITNSFLNHIGIKTGVRLDILNRIPFNSGLGNIEANITASVVAINDLLKSKLEKKQIFNFLIENISKYKLDISPSNIAANLWGGIILYNKNISNPVQKIYSPRGITFSLVLLKKNTGFMAMEDLNSELFYEQSSNIALLIKGFMISDLDLIAGAIRHNALVSKFFKDNELYDKIKDISYENEVYAVGLTGSGQNIFILNPNSLIAEKNESEIAGYLKSTGIRHKIINTGINLNGMYKY